MKKIIILAVIFSLVSACNQASVSQTGNKDINFELTQDELQSIGNDSTKGASILVKKAIKKEMMEYQYTLDEKKELEKAIEDLKMEFFLNRIASKNTYISDTEVLQLYKDNVEKLKDTDIVQILPEIKNQLFLQKVGNEKVKYMNSLVEKYDLNTVLEKYFPIQEKKEK